MVTCVKSPGISWYQAEGSQKCVDSQDIKASVKSDKTGPPLIIPTRGSISGLPCDQRCDNCFVFFISIILLQAYQTHASTFLVVAYEEREA